MKKAPIHFTKMHGLGNDFIIINALDQQVDTTQLAIKQLANRHIGIGFDQLLIIEPSCQADYFCRIYNADGTEAEQCGNGLRCIARFLHEEAISQQADFRIETKAGIFPISIDNYERISVTVGIPEIKEKLTQLDVNIYPEKLNVSVLSLGNPHAIVKVDEIDTIMPNVLGPAIAAHSIFPNGVNVGFMQVINPHHIRLRTFERGAGETCACGSNASAAVVAGRINGWLQDHVEVEFQYGKLAVEWQGAKTPIKMTGPATRVFSGKI